LWPRRCGLSGHGTERIIDDASSRIRDDTLLIIDPAEIIKKYASKMQYLDGVRDGIEAGPSSGYWACDGVAAEVGEPDIIPSGMSFTQRWRRSL
jgi:hypothetical protein